MLLSKYKNTNNKKTTLKNTTKYKLYLLIIICNNVRNNKN